MAKPALAAPRGKAGSASDAAAAPRPSLPFEHSVGYQIRETHRVVQRALQARIEKEGVSLGMWYFLRVLWEEDGITQRELSRRVGTMEPTTQSALQAMETAGFLRRVRNADDKRKLSIHLTPKGRALKLKLLPAGIEVVELATAGMSARETELLLGLLADVRRNLLRDIAISEGLDVEDAP